MKRIAILADFPWSYFDQGATGRGGGQACTWLTQIAEAFGTCVDFDIHWLTLDRRMYPWQIESRRWNNQTFTRIGGVPARADMLAAFHPSRLALRHCLRRIKPDLIHCWGTERSYPVVCRDSKVPTILSMQGILTEYARIGSFKGNKIWTRLASFETAFIQSADCVTCESSWGRERVLEIVPDKKVHLVEYGVHPDFYKITWRPDLEKPYALYVGSLDWRKGVDLLMDAAEHMADRSWRVVMAGDGPLRVSLEARKVPGVDFLGNCDWRRVQDLLSGASCLVLPTRGDTSPNVVKEALVVGLPVVTTPHGGQSGYICDGSNGLIADPLSSASIADCLSKIMNHPETIHRLGNWRRDHFRSFFESSNTAEAFLRLYNESLGATP